MNFQKIESALRVHVPVGSVDYCLELLRKHDFDFRLRKSRVTKIGDFTVRTNRSPRITVNHDLDSYLFLITYIHEVAHVIVHQQFGNRVPGHGNEWKRIFQQILEPVLNEDIFPDDLLFAIRKHMADPMATTFSDPALMQIFRKYDAKSGQQTILSDLSEGTVFGLRGRWFKKGQTKRTRVLCQEVKTRRKYLVPADAAVDFAQLSFL